MKSISRTFVVFVFVLLSYVQHTAAQQLSPEALKLRTIYVQLKIYPGSKPKQLAYIKSFPENKQQFDAIFEPNGTGQLHSEYFEYVNTFAGLAKDHQEEVINKLVSISKDLTYGPGAPKQLQLILIQLGDQYTKAFAAKLKTLSAHDLDNLTKLMADRDQIKDFLPYQELIDGLDKINEVALANKFLDARVKREK